PVSGGGGVTTSSRCRIASGISAPPVLAAPRAAHHRRTERADTPRAVAALARSAGAARSPYAPPETPAPHRNALRHRPALRAGRRACTALAPRRCAATAS